MVDPRVLIPRPETELLVEAVLRELPKDARGVLDLCTGSGCIAVTLAAERPQAAVWATDLSADALRGGPGQRRARSGGRRVAVLEGDLFAPVPRPSARFDVVVSNPPYVQTGELARLQPRCSGAEAGARRRRRRARRWSAASSPGATAGSKPGGLLALEIGDGRARGAELARAGGLPRRARRTDLARLDRLAFGTRPRGPATTHPGDATDGPILIEGGDPLERRGPRVGREERRAALIAAALLAEGAHTFRNVPDLVDVGTMLEVLRTMGADAERVGPRRRPAATSVTVRSAPGNRSPRRLRPGEDDARLGAGARARCSAASGRPGLAARRLRHRRPAHRPAPEGPRGAGRRDRARRRATSRPAPSGSGARRCASTWSPSPAPRT